MLKQHDLLKRVSWALLIVSVYLLGQSITLPLIDPAVAKASLANRTLLQTFGVMTGGQFTLPTLFTLGVGPYMTGMIIWQAISALNLDGVNHLSQRQVSYIQRWLAVGLAVLQGIQIVYYTKSALLPFPFGGGVTVTMVIVLATLLAGTMFSIYLGDLNAQYGLGGMSLLILPGIILGLPKTLTAGWGNPNYSLTNEHLLVAIGLTVIVLFILEALMHAERHLPVERLMMEGDLTHSYLPMRLLTAGAMPFMFSMSLFMLPQTLFNHRAKYVDWMQALLHLTDYRTWGGVFMYALVLMFLGYAFGLISIQPGKIGKNMKETGDYFINVFPGEQTNNYLFREFFILTTFGNLFLVVLAILPMALAIVYKQPGWANFTPYFGSLAILISIMDNVIAQFNALREKGMYRLF
ncbi:preprotein translocase subunit SecY [Weissella uvarum]|uniref:preprotein translocase subunit SecY n=1 Tax=Weissella uvarum TaxID=1479233 RepID=UPI00195F7202|nr:preprotein translocase subunit SecY [Weissella uvarum]MBM7616677.1 preprotein translocase subunit SecY [Weissella uvarum]MCM0594869.1 preprotein translocase subunit SecY [Weissella uvarum]